MTALTVSSISTFTPRAMEGDWSVPSSGATLARPTQTADNRNNVENSPCCAEAEDGLHQFSEMMQDRGRMVEAFTQFADALVPSLARIAVERPSILSQNFDFRNDNGKLRVVDTDMTPEDVAWLESRLNADPRLSKLAVEFNESILGAYGDMEHPYYWIQQGNDVWIGDAIPGLESTVDRDVKYMALLRTIRDADCGGGREGDYYRAHRYELVPDKIQDFIMSPETYRKSPSGRIIAEPSKRSSRPSSAGWVA